MSDVAAITGGNDNSDLQIFNSNKALGKDDFLKLLVTQLRYQDPMNPMENTEFVAQLAQFSSLEQMTNVDEGIQGLSLLMQSVNNSMAAGLIGKNVKFSGNAINLPEDGDAKLYYDLANKAGITIKIYDDNDKLVASLSPGEQLAGSQTFTWDGKGSDGQRLPQGNYHFEIDANDADGNPVSAVTYSVDRIKGLKFREGNAVLMLRDKEIYLAEILEILETT